MFSFYFKCTMKDDYFQKPIMKSFVSDPIVFSLERHNTLMGISDTVHISKKFT